MALYVARMKKQALMKAAAGGRPELVKRPIFKPGSFAARHNLAAGLISAAMAEIGLGVYNILSHRPSVAILNGILMFILLLPFAAAKLSVVQRYRYRRFGKLLTAGRIIEIPDRLVAAFNDSTALFRVRDVDVQAALQEHSADVEYLSRIAIPMLDDPQASAETQAKARDEIKNCMDGICAKLRDRQAEAQAEALRLQEEAKAEESRLAAEAAREAELHDLGLRKQLGAYPPVRPPSDDEQ